MAKTIALVILVFCVSCEKDENKSPQVARTALKLQLEFGLTEGENSKDSHSFRYRCTLAQGKLKYYGPYGECERGQCKHKEVSFTLDAKQYVKLLDLIDRVQLYQSFKEEKKTDQIGSYIELDLRLGLGKKRTQLRLKGMHRARQEKSQELSPEARKLAHQADQLKRLLVEFVKPQLPGAH